MCYSYISGVEIMRKTFRFSLLILSVSFLLVACGDKEEAPDASNPNEEVIRTVEVGEEYANKHGVFTVVKGSTEVVEADGGPAKLWIDKAVASSGTVEGSFVEIIGKEEIEIIQLEMNIENVSDEVISLPLGKATLITNTDRKSTRLNSSHVAISYAVFCLKKKKKKKVYIKYSHKLPRQIN